MTHTLLEALASVLGAISGAVTMGMLLWGPQRTWAVITRALRLFFLGDKR